MQVNNNNILKIFQMQVLHDVSKIRYDRYESNMIIKLYHNLNFKTVYYIINRYIWLLVFLACGIFVSIVWWWVLGWLDQSKGAKLVKGLSRAADVMLVLERATCLMLAPPRISALCHKQYQSLNYNTLN